MARLRMSSLLLDAALIAAWLTTVGMVVLHEQGSWLGGSGSFLSSLGATIESKEQWFGVYYQDRKIGFAETAIFPQERGGVPVVSIIDRGELFFNLLGQPQHLQIFAQAFVDAD